MTHSFRRGEYALIRLPLLKEGHVYMDASIVVLVEKVNMVGIPQKYFLPGEAFSTRQHHLATIHPISNQEKAAEWFTSGEKFLPTTADAVHTLDIEPSS